MLRGNKLLKKKTIILLTLTLLNILIYFTFESWPAIIIHYYKLLYWKIIIITIKKINWSMCIGIVVEILTKLHLCFVWPVINLTDKPYPQTLQTMSGCLFIFFLIYLKNLSCQSYIFRSTKACENIAEQYNCENCHTVTHSNPIVECLIPWKCKCENYNWVSDK